SSSDSPIRCVTVPGRFLEAVLVDDLQDEDSWTRLSGFGAFGDQALHQFKVVLDRFTIDGRACCEKLLDRVAPLEIVEDQLTGTRVPRKQGIRPAFEGRRSGASRLWRDGGRPEAGPNYLKRFLKKKSRPIRPFSSRCATTDHCLLTAHSMLTTCG